MKTHSNKMDLPLKRKGRWNLQNGKHWAQYRTNQGLRCGTIKSWKWDTGGVFLPEAGCHETNENPAPKPVRACSVEPVKMCFVLRGSDCPHKHTHTHTPPHTPTPHTHPRVCGVSVLSGYGRVFDCEYRQLPTLQNLISRYIRRKRLDVENSSEGKLWYRMMLDHLLRLFFCLCEQVQL